MKPASHSYQFGPFEFDPAQQELRSGEDRFPLPVALNKLLLLFVSRPEELVTREEIAATLWGDHGTIDIENGINGAIRRLRTQLALTSAEVGTSDNYVQTVVGTGYRFVAPVTVISKDSGIEENYPAAANRQEAEETAASLSGKPISPARFGWRQMALPAIVLIVLAGVASAIWKWDRAVFVSTKTSEGAISLDWFPVTYEELDDKLTAQALSPSGKFVVSSDRTGIYLLSIDTQLAQEHAPGSDNSKLLANLEGVDVDHLAWFPDERHLLASGIRQHEGKPTGRAEAWVISVAGDSPSFLLDDAALATVSPDGRHVAYARAGRSELWVADADGQGTRRLLDAKHGDVFGCLIWSPKGDRIVVNRDSMEGHASTDAEKGALAQLQQQHHWAYESYDASDGHLLARQADFYFESGSLLSDGRFFFPVEGVGSGLKLGVAMTDMATGAFRGPAQTIGLPDIGIGADRGLDLTTSSDGKVFSAVIERPSGDVYVADLRFGASSASPQLENTRRLTRHTGTTYPTSWSPGDDELVFDEGDAGRWVIARQKLDGGKLSIAADTGGRAVQGQFTPDGKWILFLHYVGKPTHVQSIDRITADGSKPELLYKSDAIVDFRCARSNSSICVVREHVGSKGLVYYELNPVTGRGVELARTAWEPNVLGDWSLSPDGTTVAMANHDPSHPGFSLIKLRAVPADDNSHTPTPQTMIRVDGFGTVLCPTWALDGKSFFVEVHSQTGYALVYIDREGHASLFLKSPDPIWAVQSHDGNKLAFPGRTALNRNVWAARLR